MVVQGAAGTHFRGPTEKPSSASGLSKARGPLLRKALRLSRLTTQVLRTAYSELDGSFETATGSSRIHAANLTTSCKLPVDCTRAIKKSRCRRCSGFDSVTSRCRTYFKMESTRSPARMRRKVSRAWVSSWLARLSYNWEISSYLRLTACCGVSFSWLA